MATAEKAAARKAPAKKSSSGSRAASKNDAIKLLTADHREVKALFQEYQKLVDHEGEDEERQELAEQICGLLTVHAQVEEEIFYPAAKQSIKEADLIDEATVEHASAKDLIAQIQDGSPSDELYDAKVKVLGEYVEHHVQEEEGQLFKQARRAKLDLEALGEQIATRKAELMSELGLGEEGDEEAGEEGGDE